MSSPYRSFIRKLTHSRMEAGWWPAERRWVEEKPERVQDKNRYNIFILR
jgi:hypothetical protein